MRKERFSSEGGRAVVVREVRRAVVVREVGPW